MASSLWQRIGCCLTGHDYSVKSDGARMFLRCKVCGRTSRGLEMAQDPMRRPSHTGRATSGNRGTSAGRTRLAAQ
jgi:hypothetical protein